MSPSGRFAVVPSGPDELATYKVKYKLYDRERDTNFALIDDGCDLIYNSPFIFCPNDSILAIPQSDENTHMSRLKLLQLHENPLRSDYWDSTFANPMFSGDGNRIALLTGVQIGQYEYRLTLKIHDLRTREVLWKISNSGSNRFGVNRDDFLMYALNDDGSTVFIYRSDTAMPAEMSTGLFYNLPDTTAFARTLPGTFGAFSGDYGMTVFSRHLTTAYYSHTGRGPIPSAYIGNLIAGEIDFTTSVQERGSDSPGKNEQSAPLYPNPSNGTVNIPWRTDGEKLRWDLFDYAGGTILSGEATSAQAMVQIILGEVVTGGRYTLRLRAVDGARVYSCAIIVKK